MLLAYFVLADAPASAHGPTREFTVSGGTPVSVELGTTEDFVLDATWHDGQFNQEKIQITVRSSADSNVNLHGFTCSDASDIVVERTADKEHNTQGSFGFTYTYTATVSACALGQSVLTFAAHENTGYSGIGDDPEEIGSEISVAVTVVPAAPPSVSPSFSGLLTTLTEGSSDAFNVAVTADPGSYRAVVSLSQSVPAGSLGGYCSTSINTSSTFASDGTQVTRPFTLYGCIPGSVTVSVQIQNLSFGTYVDVGSPVTQLVTISAATTPAISQTGLGSSFTTSDTWYVSVSSLDADLNYALRIDLPPGLGFDAATCSDRSRTYQISGATTFRAPAGTGTFTVYACTTADDYVISVQLLRSGVNPVRFRVVIDATAPSITYSRSISGLGSSLTEGSSDPFNVSVTADPGNYRVLISLSQSVSAASMGGYCSGQGQDASAFESVGSAVTRPFRLYGCAPGAVTVSAQLQRLVSGTYVDLGSALTTTVTVTAATTPVISQTGLGSSFSTSDTWYVSVSSLDADLNYALRIDLPPGLGFDAATCSDRSRTYQISGATSFRAPAGTGTFTVYACTTADDYVISVQLLRSGVNPVRFRRVIDATAPSIASSRGITGLGSLLREGSADPFNVQVTADPGHYRVIVTLSQSVSAASMGGYCSGQGQDASAFESNGSTVNRPFTLYGCAPGAVIVRAQLQRLVSGTYVDLGSVTALTVAVTAATTPTISQSGLSSTFTGSDTWYVTVSGLKSTLAYTLRIELPIGLGHDAGHCADRIRGYQISGVTTFRAPAAGTTRIHACQSGAFDVVVELIRTGVNPVRREFGTTATVSSITHSTSISGLGASVTEGSSDPFSVSVTADPGNYRVIVSLSQSVSAASMGGYCSGQVQETSALVSTGTAVSRPFTLYGCVPGSVTVLVQLQRLISGTYVELGSPVTTAVTVSAATSPTISQTGLDATFTGSDQWSVTASGLDSDLNYVLRVDLPVGLGHDAGNCADRSRVYQVNQVTSFTAPGGSATWEVHVCESGDFTIAAQLLRTGVNPVREEFAVEAAETATTITHATSISDLGTSVGEGSADQFTVDVTADPGSYRIVVALTQSVAAASLGGYCAGSIETFSDFVSSGTAVSRPFILYGCVPGSVTVSVQLQHYDEDAFTRADLGSPVTAGIDVTAAAAAVISQTGLGATVTGQDDWSVTVSGMQSNLNYGLVIELPIGLGYDAETCAERRRAYQISQASTFTAPEDSGTFRLHVCESGNYEIVVQLLRDGTNPVRWTYSMEAATSDVEIAIGEETTFLAIPDVYEIVQALGYGSLIEGNDVLVVVFYQIAYELIPDAAANTAEAHLISYVSGAGTALSVAPQIYRGLGYGHGAVALYLDAGAATSRSVEWGDGGAIARLLGNPLRFAAIPTTSAGITWRNLDRSSLALMTDVREIARIMQESPEWAGVRLIEGEWLTLDGTSYFEAAIPNLRVIAPELFPARFQEVDVRTRSSGGESAESSGLLRGSSIDNAFRPLAETLHLPVSMVQLMAVGVIGIVATVYGLRRSRGRNSGLIVIPILGVVLLGGTLIGWVPWALTLSIGLLTAIVLGFVLWGKRTG